MQSPRRWHSIPSPKTVLSIALNDAWFLGTNEGVWVLPISREKSDVCKIVSESLRAATVMAVVSNRDTLLVGAADGIAFSKDGGSNWIYASLSVQTTIAQLAMSPTFETDGIAFAATMLSGVLKSVDGGATWRASNLGLSDAEVTAMALSPNFENDATLVVAVSNGLFISRNLAASWQPLPIEKSGLPISCCALTKNKLIVGSEERGLWHVPIHTLIHSSNFSSISFTRRAAFSSGQINALAVSPDSSLVAVANPQVVAWSNDEGENWQRTEGKQPRNVLTLAVANDGMILCGTADSGLWVYA
jgi:photosystem II stability/assembly factor-like uncharacterized protein